METPTPQIPLTLGEKENVLHGKVFYEKINIHRLNQLINFDGLADKFDTNNYAQEKASQYYENEKQQLINYLKNYKKKKNAVSVKYFRTHKSKTGRVYPVKSLGLTTMSKKTRNTLIFDTMIDLDLKNAQLQILRDICHSNNIPCPKLDDYSGDNREPILREMMDKYNVSRDACKKLFIRMTLGGTFWGFAYDNSIARNLFEPTNFIDEFQNELNNIGKKFITFNQDLWKSTKSNIDKQNKKIRDTNSINNQWNLENPDLPQKPANKREKSEYGSFLSKILQEWEIRILECMYIFLRDNTDIVDGDYFVYEYDGMKLLIDRVEKYGVDKLIDDLQVFVKNKLGFNMTLEVKPMNEIYENFVCENTENEDKEGCDVIDPIDFVPIDFEFDSEIDDLEDGFKDIDVALYIYRYYCFPQKVPIEKVNDINKYDQFYISSGIKNKCQLWYSFQNGKWNCEKDGITMSKIINTDFNNKIHNYYLKLVKSVNKLPKELSNTYDRELKNLRDLDVHSRKSSFVNTIVNNLYDLCKIDDFEEKLDLNPNLVCCNNGVIDLKNKCFRKGLPSDLCSLSTNINYREYLNDIEKISADDEKIIKEIDDFFYKLFPYESQRGYMLNHLASVFYGTTANQSFNYYIGAGSNGKSQLVDLMSYVMGDYKGLVPLQLITQKRPNIGGTSSEIIKLRGVRYAVIQEPSKNDTINEGVMKELTGGDTITARGLYKEAVTFKPMFDLAICANIFLNITSNDHGTWRRIKVVEFGSKFVDEGVCEDDFIFQKDINLNKKFDIWKEYLLHKLIQIAFENEGRVGVFSMVQSATERYRISQDKVGQYINDMIVPSDANDALVLKNNLSKSFTDWCVSKYKYSIKAKELFDRLDETYDSNYVKYKGFVIKGFYCEDEDDNDNKFIDKEEQFITEFQKKYEITMDLKNDFVNRNDILLWCKENKLKINTTKGITGVLLAKYRINCFDKEFCRYKKIDGKSIQVIYGIKLKC